MKWGLYMKKSVDVAEIIKKIKRSIEEKETKKAPVI